MVKNPPANAGEESEACSIPGSGRFPGVGNGNPFQYSCLENPIDREAWPAADQGVTKNQTQLKQLSTHASMEEMQETQETQFRSLDQEDSLE